MSTELQPGLLSASEPSGDGPPVGPASAAGGSADQKLDALRALLREMGSVLVCYSGGIDSALVLAVAHEQLGERAVGITAVSPSLAPREREDAARFAEG